MCGFAGFLNTAADRNAGELEQTARRMNDTLRHRGPDDSGVWVDPEAGVALGHRRLSIIDLSPEGHQPMASEDGRLVMIFNGEIYNYQPIREELIGLGCRFRGHSDTEVMLAAFRRWGVRQSLERFNGMFSFALWDRHERTLYLSRDRMGKKPLYYGWSGGTLVFGSELKALEAYPGFDGRIDREALALYTRLSYIPAPYSIYTGVRKLLPGTFVTIDPVTARARRMPDPVPYWSARDAVQSSLANPFHGSSDEALEQLETLLTDAVRIRMIADVPLGAFLSGGIDSSLVVALMHQAQGHGAARTFSIGFSEEAFNEARHAKAVAEHLASNHTELYVSAEQAMAVIPKLTWMYDEPFADSSQIPTYLVSEMARRDVTVSLSGDGGDELFAGYSNYFSTDRFFKRYGKLPAGLRSMLAAGATAGSALPNGSGARLKRLSRFLSFRTQEDVAYMASSYWLDPSELLPGVSEPRVAATDPARHISGCSLTEKMMYLDAVTYLPDDILVKVDRASMAVSLEARCPLLDYRVMEFAWRLPMSMKVVDGQGKWILRQLLYRFVPREIIDRPKQGFALPVGNWIRGPLRDWAESLIGDAAIRDAGVFEAAPIRRRWERHLSGAEDATGPLWIVLMAQSWLQAHRSQRAAASIDS